jgi:gas vesicle protein
MNNDVDSSAAFISGIVVGALAGSVLALMFEPVFSRAVRDGRISGAAALRRAIEGRYQELAGRDGVTSEVVRGSVDAAVDVFEASALEVVRSLAERTRSSVGASERTARA